MKELDRNPSLWFKKSIQKPQVWELSRLCHESSIKLNVHEFGFWSIFNRQNKCISLFLPLFLEQSL